MITALAEQVKDERAQVGAPCRGGCRFCGNPELHLVVDLGMSPLCENFLSRDQLLDLSRGRSASVFDRSIDVQVSRLRRKIEQDPKEPALIKTVRSGGYILAANVVAVGA